MNVALYMTVACGQEKKGIFLSYGKNIPGWSMNSWALELKYLKMLAKIGNIAARSIY